MFLFFFLALLISCTNGQVITDEQMLLMVLIDMNDYIQIFNIYIDEEKKVTQMINTYETIDIQILTHLNTRRHSNI